MRSTTIVVMSALIAASTLCVSAVVHYASHAFDIGAFDLSELQSPYFNPDGYAVSSVGVYVSALMLVVYAWRVNRRCIRTSPRVAVLGAGALAGSMVLFMANAAHSFVQYDNWPMHGVFARLGFMLLIIAHFALAPLGHTIRTDRAVATVSLLVAVVLFVLPRYADLDLVSMLTRLRSDDLLGISEVAYLAVAYQALYRFADSEREEVCQQ